MNEPGTKQKKEKDEKEKKKGQAQKETKRKDRKRKDRHNLNPRAPGAGVDDQRSSGWGDGGSAGSIESCGGPEARSERPATGHGQP
jgi:hypothetical protein